MITRAHACFTPTDQSRQLRLQLAWVSGDKPALDLVLDEVLADPAGAVGLLFALVQFSTRLGEQAHPQTFASYLRQELALARSPDPETA